MKQIQHDYRFLKPLGSGAEGEVWLAEDLRRDQLLVSWKRLFDSSTDRKIPSEFRTLQGIQHPALATVLESGLLPDGAGRWFTSPFFPGQSIDKLPRPIDPALLEGIIRRAVEGIAALHRSGYRHGDLKPAHLLWNGPRPLDVQLIDLGHAALLDDPSPINAGTPPYAAPELWSSSPKPRRNTDLYALAMIALEVLRGAPVQQSVALSEWRDWHQHGNRESALSGITVQIRGAFHEVIRSCLQPAPDDRPLDAEAILQQLQPFEPTKEDSAEQRSRFDELPLIGRDHWLTTKYQELNSPDGPAGFLLLGEARSGRTRLVRALAARVKSRGGIAVEGASSDPIHQRALSTLSQQAPCRLLWFDNVMEHHFESVIQGWKRVRSLAGSSETRLIAIVDPSASSAALAHLKRRLAGISGPVKSEFLAGLDRTSFHELFQYTHQSKGRSALAPTEIDALWRSSGGSPASLAPDPPRPPSSRHAQSVLGPRLGSWLAHIPTSLPWHVLKEASGNLDEELEDLFLSCGSGGPTRVESRGETRVLPWPAIFPVDSSIRHLAETWRDRDAPTGRWAALYLEAISGIVISSEAWRIEVESARLREDPVSLLSLAQIAPQPELKHWLEIEGRALSGEAQRVVDELPDHPSELNSEQSMICSTILQTTAGPARALPYALHSLEHADKSSVMARKIHAACIAHESGDGKLVDSLVRDLDNRSELSPHSLFELGSLHLRRGRFAEAEPCLSQALKRSRGGVSPPIVLKCMSALAGHARLTGDLQTALQRIQVAHRYASFLKVEEENPGLVGNLGAILHSLRRSDEALLAYLRANQLVKRRPDPNLEVHLQLGLGTVLRDRGSLFEAYRALRRSVRLARTTKMGPILAAALGNTGDLELLMGNPRASAIHRSELLELAEKVGDPALLRQARIALAAASLHLGQWNRSNTLLEAAEEAKGVGGLRLDSWNLVVRAEWLDLHGDRRAALTAAAAALRTAFRSGRSYMAATSLRLISRQVAKLGDVPRAIRLLSRGLELARQDPCPPLARIPLELEKLHWTESLNGERRTDLRLTLARNARQHGLLEEFLVATAPISDLLPDDLAEAQGGLRGRLLRRYGHAGIDALEKRRGFTIAARVATTRMELQVSSSTIEDSPEEPSLELPERLQNLSTNLGADGALALSRPIRAWRHVCKVGNIQSPEASDLPTTTTLWPGSTWSLWIPIHSSTPCALWLQGSGQAPDIESLDLRGWNETITVHRLKSNEERLKKLVKQLRSDLQDSREEKISERARLETQLLTQRLEVTQDGESPSENSIWISESPAMKALEGLLPQWAKSQLPILLWGESGVGKSALLSRLSRLSGESPITENCAALPEPLLEAELFGYVPGAFTGAEQEHSGLFERAAGNSLILDHLDELPLNLQAKLLRVLDSGKFRPLGAEEDRQVQFRLIATLRDDPQTLIEQNRLRLDLYYRLQGIEGHVPPLRRRREEIGPLLEAYLSEAARIQVRPQPTIHPQALSILEAADWPGNVRELVNATQRWLIQSVDTLRPEDLDREFVQTPAVGDPSGNTAFTERKDAASTTVATWSGEDWRTETERFHRGLLRAALDRFAGNQTQTAQALGISRRHLQNLLNKLDLREQEE